MKDIIQESTLNIIRKNFSLKRFSSSDSECSTEEEEEEGKIEFKDIDGALNTRLLRIILDEKHFIRKRANATISGEMKMTATLTFLLQVLSIIIELSEDFFLEDHENEVSEGNSAIMRLVRTTSHVIGRIICHHTIKVEYSLHEELNILYDSNNIPFHNWDRSIENRQACLTLYPKTRYDIQRAIMYAKEKQKRIKVAGTKHTWNEVFIDDSKAMDERQQGNIMLCMLPESVTNPLMLAELLEDEEGKIDYDMHFFIFLMQWNVNCLNGDQSYKKSNWLIQLRSMLM